MGDITTFRTMMELLRGCRSEIVGYWIWPYTIPLTSSSGAPRRGEMKGKDESKKSKTKHIIEQRYIPTLIQCSHPLTHHLITSPPSSTHSSP